ncbi:unnamed protein product [Brassica rapa subsp. narinosa]
MEVRKRKNADGGASVNAGDDRTPSSVSSTSDRTVRSNVMVSMILLDSSKAPRLMQSAFSTLGDLYLYKLSDALYGESVASWSVSFLCSILSHFQKVCILSTQHHVFIFFCMNRTFSNCLETVLTIMGLYYYRSFQGLSSQSEVRFGHSGPSTCLQLIKWSPKLILSALFLLCLSDRAKRECCRFQQRGTEDAMNYLSEEAYKGRVKSILFLMPCHSTPYYSTLHSNIPMQFLDCTPR